MAKNKVSEWSATPANNTDIGGINIAEGCAPSGINNAIRELMAQVKDMQSGTDADNFTVGGNLSVTGTATGVTPTLGDSSTKFATTEFLKNFYPVGSVYINASSSTNPATFFGFGTWVAFAAGRVMVGLDASNAAFDTAEETGGSADAIVVSHTHTATSSVNDPGHTHELATATSDTSAGKITNGGDGTQGQLFTNSSSTGISVSTSISSTGSSGTNANLQPYITVYMWKRTA